ncbi:MAG: DNA mismatch repair protein MutS [Acidobacteria bacterium]|nr:DNA mismatch repair protein MutS [Acidobacteriota bacterium]
MDKKQTPMLKQYQEVKKQYPGTLLFFRLGDFYELFYDDAILGAKELEITLTARHRERGQPIPMCGVPHHAITGYVAKLIRKGYRVAICDQVEDPAAATKLVKREVVRVITPGTAIESQLLEAGENNYLAAIFGYEGAAGASFLDVSTGEFWATEFAGQAAWEKIIEQLGAFSVREILYPPSLEPLVRQSSTEAPNEQAEAGVDRDVARPTTILDRAVLTPMDEWLFNYEHCQTLLCEHFGVNSLDGYGLGEKELAVGAAGVVVHYVRETQKAQATHITGISYFQPSESMVLDATTVRNLELIESLHGDRDHNLLKVIDATHTPMGARLLKQWVLRPSLNLGEINQRLDAVAELKGNTILRDQLRQELKKVQDLERLIARINLGTANPRDLLALRNSADTIPTIKQLLGEVSSSLLEVLRESLDELTDVRQLISSALAENPPANLSEGGVIRAGHSAELDELRSMATNSKATIAGLEQRERKRTGIQSLKVKYNNVFGYFIEISKANLRLVPPDYERRQTLVSAERFTTPELKEYEAKILGAEERILELETTLFQEVRRQVAVQTRRIQASAKALAFLDVLAGFAETAARRNYCRPILRDDDELYIKDGRHPILEAIQGRFIPNDLYMNNSTDRLLIITGPNMGGKSVFLRQAGLICILAQMGSFVPAREACLGLIDRIFTRVGASDSLGSGRSTFMVEMIETANILNTASPRSLVILDEVGRGTATFDGLSIAWAVAEYIHNNANHAAKTLFATHYHEMTELEKLLPGACNYQAAVKEAKGEIIFLHRMVQGSASKSYGIEVARLAGLPRPVIERAREILENLEANELDPTGKPKLAEHLPSRGENWKRQPSLFDLANTSVITEIQELDAERLTPEEAKQKLRELKQKLM